MSYSQAELDALKAAYASGVTEVRYDGKMTRYDSGEALYRRIQVIEAEIARTAAGTTRPKAGFAAFSRD